MKKIAIAAAVAGAFSVNATAAEITTYFEQQYALGMTDTGGDTSFDTMGIDESGNNMLNWNYSDDLGNGLSLVGTYSMVINGNNNRSATTNRNSAIGLKGDFGTITMGTHEAWTELGAILQDGYGAALGNGGSTVKMTRVGRSSGGTGGFTNVISNSVQWASNDMNGLSVIALWGSGTDTATATTDEEYTDLYIKYNMGGVKLHAGFASASDYGGTQGNTMDGSFVGIGYDFGAIQLNAETTNVEVKQGSTTWEVDGGHINLIMPTADGRVVFNYASSGDQKENNATINNSDWNGYDISYQHDASANTMLFIRYANQTEGQSYNATATTNEDSFTNISAGIRFQY